MIKPELLVPAGNLEKLKIAVIYGADAVFIGGREYGLRANTNNFSIDDIKEACDFAHSFNCKIYVTTNIFFHNENIDGFIDYIKELEKCGVDALITADIYAIKMIVKHTSIEVHLSTQQSVLNKYSAKFFEELGVTRIVLARECNREEIIDIMKFINIDIELFIHGSMCIGYSGRCMLSNHMTARDSNRGGCSQNCRWEFEVENDTNMFSMNPDDLVLINHVKDMANLGVASLKVEGRMRSIYYIANTVFVYRKLIDAIYENKYFNISELENDLIKSANRRISGQYYAGIPSYTQQLFQQRDEPPTKDFCCIVLESDNNLIKIEQRNYFVVGNEIEFIVPHKDKVCGVVKQIYDSQMNKIEVARHPQEVLYIDIGFILPEFSIGRLVKI